MAILIDENTKVICQGITGSAGSFHARECLAYGTKLVAGVTPGKGGTKFDGVPVFNTVSKARQTTGANASMVFVPASFAADAILEASAAGKPVLGTKIKGLSEAVIHEKTGLLIEPENVEALTVSLDFLMENSEKRQSLGYEGRMHATKFSWKSISSEQFEFYKAVMEKDNKNYFKNVSC